MKFREVLTEAVGDMTLHGYDNQSRLEYWVQRLREAAQADLPSPKVLEQRMKRAMETIYKRVTSKTALKRRHPQVSLFTLQRIEPQFRPELTKRILASTQLIKLNRQQAIEKTLQRFSGWATSVPEGGSKVVERAEVKADIEKPLKQQKYEERRLDIDQGHKLMASIDAVIAEQTDAIAGMWRSHWRRPGYDYREDHKERDGKVYAIRGNWAMEKGLMNKGAGYLDEMTQVGEEPFCSCFMVFYQNLRDLPDAMLTAKGRKLLEETRIR